MLTRTLGASDLTASVIGLGTMSWKDCRYGVQATSETVLDKAGTQEMVRVALECGITLFDTAEGYGRGTAEELLGSALHELKARDQAVIVTKVGPLFTEEQSNGRTCNLSAAHIRDRCEKALRRLKTDHIDLYLAHWPDTHTPIEETAAVMQELREAGKIRWFGVSNFSNDLLGSALKHIPVAVNQLPYSMIDRGIDADRRPFCLEHNVAIMAYSPLGKGMLSGKYTKDHLPPADDYRHQRPHFAKENLEKHLALAQRIRETAQELGITPTQLVLAWTVAQPGITVTIPGARTIEQVRDNAGAGKVKLTPEVMAKLGVE